VPSSAGTTSTGGVGTVKRNELAGSAESPASVDPKPRQASATQEASRFDREEIVVMAERSSVKQTAAG
jgi:hypothetical protein